MECNSTPDAKHKAHAVTTGMLMTMMLKTLVLKLLPQSGPLLCAKVCSTSHSDLVHAQHSAQAPDPQPRALTPQPPGASRTLPTAIEALPLSGAAACTTGQFWLLLVDLSIWQANRCHSGQLCGWPAPSNPVLSAPFGPRQQCWQQSHTLLTSSARAVWAAAACKAAKACSELGSCILACAGTASRTHPSLRVLLLKCVRQKPLKPSCWCSRLKTSSKPSTKLPAAPALPELLLFSCKLQLLLLQELVLAGVPGWCRSISSMLTCSRVLLLFQGRVSSCCKTDMPQSLHEKWRITLNRMSAATHNRAGHTNVNI